MVRALWRKPLEEYPGPDSEGQVRLGWVKGIREETMREDGFDSSRKQESTRPGKKCKAAQRSEQDAATADALVHVGWLLDDEVEDEEVFLKWVRAERGH